MSKTTYLLIGIMLAAVIIPYVYFVNWSVVTYRAYVDDLRADAESKIPGGGEYVHPYPFQYMWYGKVAIVAGILILVGILVTIGIVIMSNKNKTRTAGTTGKDRPNDRF